LQSADYLNADSELSICASIVGGTPVMYSNSGAGIVDSGENDSTLEWESVLNRAEMQFCAHQWGGMLRKRAMWR
jgi:hypothetical protein